MSEHAVIVRFQYGSTDLGVLLELEEKLEAAIVTAGAGEYDGNEIAADGSHGSLYMYGSDADRLVEVILPILEAAPFMAGAEVTKRTDRPRTAFVKSSSRLGPEDALTAPAAPQAHSGSIGR